MAYAKITLENPQTGIIKKAPVGFSWTLFWIGPVIALFRGDIKGGFLMLLLLAITSGISWIFYPFMYNKYYIKELLKKGYRVSSVEDSDLATLKQKLGINLPEK